MRTDVKVGLVCVLILIIAVVAYFAMQGKSTDVKTGPRTATGNTGAAATPATPPTNPPAPSNTGSFAPPPSTPDSTASPLAYTPVGPAQTPTPYSPSSSTTMPASGGANTFNPNSGTAQPLLPPAGSTSTSGNPRTTYGPTPASPTGPTTGTPTYGPGTDTGLRSGNDSLREPTPGNRSTVRPDPSGLTGGTVPSGTTGGTRSDTGLTGTTGGGRSTATGSDHSGGLTGGSGNSYIVQSGDNLTTIARKNHVSLKDLKAANPGINYDSLKLKQKINIPAASATTSTPTGGSSTRGLTSGATPAGTASGATARPSTGTRSASTITPGKTYKVKSGDSLRKIAKAAYGNEKQWTRIFRANRGEMANANDLKAGMTLTIPK
jgi:LysM repeat protein